MLGHDLAAVLPELRAHAESLMLDAGKALRPTGERVYDRDQQADVDELAPLFGDDAWPVRCKIQSRDTAPRESEVGGRTAVEVRTELHLPADTEPLAVGDVWEFVEVHDLSLATVGQRVRVLAPVAGTLKTARRYAVEEVVA